MVAQPVTQANVAQDLPIDCVLCGDSLDVLSRFPDNSIDAIVCDPPAGINFMNKPFDDDRGGRDAWIAWLAAIMREALRVTKPGGHAFVWALPRTSHWTATALEDSGWSIRDVITHLFGSGFPKSLNLGNGRGTALKPASEHWILCRKPLSEKSIAENCLKWNCGALNIDGCRVQSAGNESNARVNKAPIGSGRNGTSYTLPGNDRGWDGSQGRFPSNLLLSHSVFCVPQGTKRVKGANWKDSDNQRRFEAMFEGGWKDRTGQHYTDPDGYEEVEDYLCDPSCPILQLDRQSGIRRTSPKLPHHHDGRNGMFGLPSGKAFYEAEGGASRYFQSFSPDIEVPFRYVSKSSRKERNQGCEGLPEVERHTQGRDVVHWIDRHDGKGKVPVNARIQPAANDHPTVKSLSLMKWLVKLVGVPGGVILDPFCGSGSTLVACVYEGLHYIGIDQDQHYVNIAEARIAHAVQEVRGW